MNYKIPIILTPEPEGGFTVTSPDLPELITEGDTPEEIVKNVAEAFQIVLEIYADDGRPLPASITLMSIDEPVRMDTLITVP